MTMRKKLLVAVVAIFMASGILHAKEGGLLAPNRPWFTGPFFAPSSLAVPYGYTNVEPNIFATIDHAFYNQHWRPESMPNMYVLNTQFSMQIGVTSWMDVQFAAQFFWEHTESKSATRFGDFPINLDIQLYTYKKPSWWPFNIKLIVKETFPTGKYRKLNPSKLGLDGVGSGIFATTIGLALGRTFHLTGIHFLQFRSGWFYTWPSRVHVKGFNSYGGGYGTNGYIYPGQQFYAVLSTELNFTQNWAFSCDYVGVNNPKQTFKGYNGVNADGTPASNVNPSNTQFSLAPAIEYNWSEELGLIAGVWFTVAGRNTFDFASFAIALNYYGPIKNHRHDKKGS